MVCWRPVEKHAESERGDGAGSLQSVGRQRAGETSTFSSGGTVKSTSPFCAFIVIHEQSARVGTPVLYKDNTIQKCQLQQKYECLNAITESLAPGESLLGAHLKNIALHCLEQQEQVARRAMCQKTVL